MIWRMGTAASLLLLVAAASPQSVDLPGARLFPESMSIARDGTAYVGSVTGGVLRVSLKTGKTEQWIAPGAFGSGALFGVLVDPVNGVLWTCNNDFSARGNLVPGSDRGSMLKGFDLKSGRLRLSMALPGEKPVCNDIAVATNGTVYVTDTAAPQLLRWRKGQTALEVWVRDPALGAGLDGIAIASDGHVYVNNIRTGELFRIAVESNGNSGAVTKLKLSRPLAAPDGMRSIGGQSFVVAEEGVISRVTVHDDAAEVQTLVEKVKRPTGVELHKGMIWYSQGQVSLFFNPKPGETPDPSRLVPVPLPRN